MSRKLQRGTVGILLLWALSGTGLQAGGSGLNTVVVVNRASAGSCEVGNYFCERRLVPPGNVLHIEWPGGNTLWTSNDFHAVLLAPLLQMLSERRLTNQAQYVVLSPDIPFQTSVGPTINSTTSALFYGLKSTGDPGVTNSYAASEANFARARPASAPGASFLTVMITGNSVAQAKQLIDQGAAGDGTCPVAPVLLEKTSDYSRNLRHTAFDNAIFNARIRKHPSMLRTNSDSLYTATSLFGAQTGLATFSVSPGTFVPGAIADSMSSFGGIIFGSTGQTTLLEFIQAGASGSYGTVAEPGTDPQKFPNPQVYFYQARGFSLAESYYQGIAAPYLGLMVGEPLAAPFAAPGSGRWEAPPPDAILTGDVPAAIGFSAAPAQYPFGQVDLFVDGLFAETLTNMGPCAGNELRVELNGYAVTCLTPTNATLSAVAQALASALNAAVVTNATKIRAQAFGDRVELQCSTNPWSVPFYVADPEATNLADTEYRVVYVPESTPPRLIPLGGEPGSGFTVEVEMPVAAPYVLQAATNLEDWLSIFTNSAMGLVEFQDFEATNYPARFYRMFGTLGEEPPAPPPPPAFTVLGDTNGDTQVRVDYAAQPYIVEVSRSGGPWTGLCTNFAVGAVRTGVATALGTGDRLRTFLSASRPRFVESEACGRQNYVVIGTMPPAGAWLQFTIIKTNGLSAVAGATNSAGYTSAEIAAQVCAQINAHPDLQDPGGVVADDFTVDAGGTASFALRARSAGLDSAAIRVIPRRSNIIILPSSQGTLTQNRADLQPRNHVYVSAGSGGLAFSFLLHTAGFPDGYHVLTAVAYEGSHVQTQTQASIPIRIRNSPLAATFMPVGIPDPAPVQGAHQFQIDVNTNDVNCITLFSTGGALEAVTNVSSATFTVQGTQLGVGLHPFHALVETSSGGKYRTETIWVRLADIP